MVRVVMVVRSVMVVRVGRLLTMGVVRRGRAVRWERVAGQLTWNHKVNILHRTLKHREAATILARTLYLSSLSNILPLVLLYLDVAAGLVHLAVAPWGEGIRGAVGISLEGASSIPS